jgi:protein-tyrosine phosphatase
MITVAIARRIRWNPGFGVRRSYADAWCAGPLRSRGAVIDLHCHILPGIDDGAADTADSVAMAAQAQDDGIELVCATPHIRWDHEVRIPELAGRVAALNEMLASHRIRTRVATGGEVAETSALDLDASELEAVSLGGGGGWILLEPRPGPLADSIAEVVDHLTEHGFRSVIAHPERHPGPDLIARLAALVERGALVQGTAALLEPEDIGPLAYLARHGVLHLLGSDSHSSRAGRPVRLSTALTRLETLDPVGSHLEWVARDAPAGVVRGDPIEPPFEPRASAAGG